MTFEQYVACYHPKMTIKQARVAVARNMLIFADHVKQATKRQNSVGQTVLVWNDGKLEEYSVLFEDNANDTIGNDPGNYIFAEFRNANRGETERFSSSDEFLLFMTRYY